ncbi:MAG: polymerase sigma factor FliA [Candidatus Atribacteria bacterium]|nr:polymerase sigma factor FliA [Candidatus Atribacteria bacterium]
MSLARKIDDLEKVWNDYLLRRDPQAKEKLVNNYLYLVKIALGRLIYLLPSYIDREDLESYGIVGLLQAMDRFQPGRGLKFETFALSRIRGAVLDYLRSLDPMTRGQRKTMKEVTLAWQKLTSNLGREPTISELAQEVGVSVEAVSWIVEQDRSTLFLSWEKEREEEEALSERVAAPSKGFDPQEALENQELVSLLKEAIDQLPEREKLCITLYYYEGLTLKEIGAIIGVGESRVSQLLARAIVWLRSKIAE